MFTVKVTSVNPWVEWCIAWALIGLQYSVERAIRKALHERQHERPRLRMDPDADIAPMTARYGQGIVYSGPTFYVDVV